MKQPYALVIALAVVATIWWLSHVPEAPVPMVLVDPVGDPIGKPSLDPDRTHLHRGQNGMVACDVPLCSQMGVDILQQGGNAADAAVTVALCIGSVNSHSSGIGGGAYIISARGRDDVVLIDAREMAPGATEIDQFSNPLVSKIGGLAVAVPGELKGLERLFELHGLGNLTWAQLIAPVIELNEKGWEALEIWTRALAKLVALAFSYVPLLAESWDFIYKDGRIVKQGETVRRPALARTLGLVARNGSSAVFYDPHGPIAPSLAAAALRLGGVVTPNDFAHYNVSVQQPVGFAFGVGEDEYQLYTTRGVSSGPALAAGLNFWQAVNHHQPTKDDGVLMHRLAEAMKWVASARTYLGDRVNSTTHAALVDRFTSKAWSRWLAQNKYLDSTTFPWHHYRPQFEAVEDHGTAHFSVVDARGYAVGITTTVNLLFGSMVYDNVTGIVLNDEMDDFSFPHTRNAFNLTPLTNNYAAPYHRPLSLMAPTIVYKQDRVHLVIGAAGGSRIPTAIMHAIIRKVYQGLSLLEVLAFPRVHHQLIPEFMQIEDIDAFNAEHHQDMAANLHHRGHSLQQLGALTAMNAIGWADGWWEGVSDYWRKRGEAAGY